MWVGLEESKEIWLVLVLVYPGRRICVCYCCVSVCLVLSACICVDWIGFGWGIMIHSDESGGAWMSPDESRLVQVGQGWSGLVWVCLCGSGFVPVRPDWSQLVLVDPGCLVLV